MCGIVGYIGNQDSKEVLLKGLEKLEYRGYDSAGIAVANEEGIHLFREKGRIADLRLVVNNEVLGNVGIGHTRWATHGAPCVRNAHPHQSKSERFTLVHNGVIENYEQLKAEYLSDVELQSDTDTEVIVQLVGKFAETGISTEEAFVKTLELIHGSYAFAMIDREDKETIYVAKNKSPLLVGVGEAFNVVASDAMATLQVTDKYLEINDKEVVIVKALGVTIKNLAGIVQEREPFVANIDAGDIEKGTYPHYMLKEIDEQPGAIRKIIQTYQNDKGELTFDQEIIDSVMNADRLYVVACGTSYNAGLVGKNMIEKMAGIPVEVHVASEFAYSLPLLSERPLFVFLSQSGETADSRAGLVRIKELGYKSLTVTNVQGSTLSREADFTILLHAGPEIAVASTKAYTSQVAIMAILADLLAKASGKCLDVDMVRELGIIANSMDSLINDKVRIEEITKEYLATTRNCFFIGRGVDYLVGLEASLKLKEISYIQTEGFAGGELKHGTIALIEEGTPVFAIATQAELNLSIRGNVQEVVARGAKACIISVEGIGTERDQYLLPAVNPNLTPLVSVVPLQLVAYYASLHRGCDVDKPRNLAKSVTVE